MRPTVALLLLFVACGGGAKSGPAAATTPQAPTPDPIPTTPGPTCASVAEQLAHVLLADAGPERQQSATATREKLAAMCEQDGWSDPTRSCLATAQSDAELDGCTKLMTQPQRGAFTGESRVAPAAAAAPDGGAAAPRKSTTRAPVKKNKGDSDPCEGGE